MSNQKKTKAIYPPRPDFEVKAVGFFEVKINKEPLPIGEFGFALDPTFTWLNVHTPHEEMLTKIVTFMLPENLKPGTYDLQDRYNFAALTYWQDIGSGPVYPGFEFRPLRGTFTLDEIDYEHPRMKGSFEFHAWGFGQLLPCEGTFDIHDGKQRG